jgi:putative oxidoreductase
MKDFGLLALRVVVGGLLAGHGAQKLFGAFEGPGMAGTQQMVARTGLHPPDVRALAAGGSEFGGGMLTALGLLWPIGPITTTLPPMTSGTSTPRR